MTLTDTWQTYLSTSCIGRSRRAFLTCWSYVCEVESPTLNHPPSQCCLPPLTPFVFQNVGWVAQTKYGQTSPTALLSLFHVDHLERQKLKIKSLCYSLIKSSVLKQSQNITCLFFPFCLAWVSTNLMVAMVIIVIVIQARAESWRHGMNASLCHRVQRPPMSAWQLLISSLLDVTTC